ncbi:MAG: ABC transporter permease [Oligoflexia bacterium]|nr:ABC transporter permease [Oligoflexia bacterium]
MSTPATGRLRTWLVQYRAVFFKEVRQTLQDRRIVFLLTVAPFVQLLLLGYAIDLDVDHVPTVVVDQDGSPESRQTVQALLADGTLERTGSVDSVAQANALLERGTVAVALVVPDGFARDLSRGTPTELQVILDGTDPTRSGIAASAVSRYLGERGLILARQRLAKATGGTRGLPSVEVRPRLLFNPRLSSAIYMVPGIAGMLLLIVTMLITAMGLAREQEVGTLEQVRVTPLPPLVLMLGKVMPYVIVGLVDVSLAITAGAWIFGVPLRGSMLLFYAFNVLFLLNTVGLGLLISTSSQTQQQAFIGAFVIVLPALLLSGTLTPIHAMPSWLQPITWINPLRFYLEGSRAILLKGAQMQDLWPQAVILMGSGVVILAAASLRFRKIVA